MSASVRARGVRKSFRDGERTTVVLEGIDLDVAAGEALAIVGPSGSGKSTLLHILGGLERPDTGEVSVAGRDLGPLSTRELADFRNQTIGFVFQFHQLLPDFTAFENTLMPGRIRGGDLEALAERSRDLLSQVGLSDRLDHFPNQLSGGERQRVALCRALLLEPPLLLADEPTGNLDKESGEVVLDLLFELRERLAVTLVLVTHNPAVANRCAKIRALRAGQIERWSPQNKGSAALEM